MSRLITRITGALLAILSVMIMQGCGGDVPAEPMDAVPDDARLIAAMNLDKLAQAYGAEKLTDNDGLTPDAAEALSIFIPADLFQPLKAVLTSSGNSGATRTSDMVMFTAANGYTSLILKVNDSDRLTGGTLSSFRDSKIDFGGYKCFTLNNRVIAISESLCIISPDAATARSAGEHTQATPVSPIEGVRQFLLTSTDDAICLSRKADDIFGNKMKGLWLCGSLRFSDRWVNACLTAIQPDGRPDSIGSRVAGRIDPDIIGFIPQGCSLVIASGKQSGEGKLFGAEELTSRFFPGQTTLSDSGTTLWYARPAGALNSENLMTPEVWNFANIMQTQQANAEALTERLTDTYPSARRDTSTGLYETSAGDYSVTFGYADGYYIQGVNGPVSYCNSNQFTQDFNAARLVGILDIPKGSALQNALSLPCGATVSLKVTDLSVNARITLYGAQAPVLATLSSVPALHNLLPLLMTLN